MYRQQPPAGGNFPERVRPDGAVWAGDGGCVPAAAAEEEPVTWGCCWRCRIPLHWKGSLIYSYDQWKDSYIQEGPSTWSPCGNAHSGSQDAPWWPLAIKGRNKGSRHIEGELNSRLLFCLITFIKHLPAARRDSSEVKWNYETSMGFYLSNELTKLLSIMWLMWPVSGKLRWKQRAQIPHQFFCRTREPTSFTGWKLITPHFLATQQFLHHTHTCFLFILQRKHYIFKDHGTVLDFNNSTVLSPCISLPPCGQHNIWHFLSNNTHCSCVYLGYISG